MGIKIRMSWWEWEGMKTSHVPMAIYPRHNPNHYLDPRTNANPNSNPRPNHF